MADTVREQRKILLDSPIPDQSEIRKRMERLFGKSSLVLKDIIAPCAEEAERLLYDLISSSVNKTPVMIKAVRHSGSRHVGRKRATGYRCTKCRYDYVRYQDSYCGGCGKPIEWI